MITKFETPITIKKGRTEITLALGIGAFNPDESKTKNFNIKIFKYDPWIKFDGKWYFLPNGSKFNSLSDMDEWIRMDCYTEEKLLEKIFKLLDL